VLWPKVALGGPLVRPIGQLGWPGGQGSWPHQLWALDAPCSNLPLHVGKVEIEKVPTFLDTLAKRTLGIVIFSATMPYFGHIEGMHGFWSI
jgi:hypothetical protein